MYYPILRGRQNELLAIRELLEAGKLDNVVPIVEPVKASSTLLSTIKSFRDKEHPLAIVANPLVGDFAKDLSKSDEYYRRYRDLIEDFPGLIRAMHPVSEVDTEICNGKTMLFYAPESKTEFENMLATMGPEYVLIPSTENRVKRHLRCKTISLDRSYRVQLRNADYREHEEDRITEENVFFNEDGHVGFADYSIIGEDFNVGGFMPRVVALHLAYLNKADQDSVWVHHFTSALDIPNQDIGRKFTSALAFLVDWANDNGIEETLGLSEFRKLRELDRFPGLGYAKKIAIKHHLELVNDFLAEGKA